MSSDDEKQLMEVLEDRDLELRFHDGRRILFHAVKPKLASLGGVLRSLMEDEIEEQTVKRVRTDSGNSSPPVSQVRQERGSHG